MGRRLERSSNDSAEASTETDLDVARHPARTASSVPIDPACRPIDVASGRAGRVA